MEIISHSVEETADLAAKILVELGKRKSKREPSATIVALKGDLGAGKTTFAQEVARALGVTERVTSPTFVIMKNYQISCQGFPLPSPWQRLAHIDCYRLNSPDDLIHLNWAELITDPNNLILVEWPERVGDLLSAPAMRISFEVVGDNSRKIVYD